MNPWIQHIKQYASKKGISYTQALKDPNAKKGYKPKAKGGAVYGDRDEEDDAFNMSSVQSAVPPTPSRRIVRAIRPRQQQQTQGTMSRLSAPEMQSQSRVVRKGKTPSTGDPKRITVRANFLRGLIEVAEDDEIMPRRVANELRKEIDLIVKDTTSSVSEKIDDLLQVEKSVRVYEDTAYEPGQVMVDAF